jgi:hypothetical protein
MLGGGADGLCCQVPLSFRLNQTLLLLPVPIDAIASILLPSTSIVTGAVRR